MHCKAMTSKRLINLMLNHLYEDKQANTHEGYATIISSSLIILLLIVFYAFILNNSGMSMIGLFNSNNSMNDDLAVQTLQCIRDRFLYTIFGLPSYIVSGISAIGIQIYVCMYISMYHNFFDFISD